jgi:hypothetical protein
MSACLDGRHRDSLVDHASGRTTPDNEPTRPRLRRYGAGSLWVTQVRPRYRPRHTAYDCLDLTSHRGEPPSLDDGSPTPPRSRPSPPELRSASTLAACKFTLGARGVRIAGQHATGRVQERMAKAEPYSPVPCPRPRPSTPVPSNVPWVLRSGFTPEDGRQSIGLSCRRSQWVSATLLDSTESRRLRWAVAITRG